MISKVFSNIKDNGLIKKDDNIVVGVSGGPDSMALLYALLELKDAFGFNMPMSTKSETANIKKHKQ